MQRLESPVEPIDPVAHESAVAAPGPAPDDLPVTVIERRSGWQLIDLRELWRDDLVAFVLGCSFSFEEALLEAGLPLRHIAEGKNVPMYRTSIDTAPAGPFRGKLVVSMRPFTPANAIRAIEITSRFPRVHGAPVHIGMPGRIGIEDLARPWVGDPTPVMEDELPLFWACGVTPQSVVRDARPPLCITHMPGHMIVTDLKNASLALA